MPDRDRLISTGVAAQTPAPRELDGELTSSSCVSTDVFAPADSRPSCRFLGTGRFDPFRTFAPDFCASQPVQIWFPHDGAKFNYPADAPATARNTSSMIGDS